jgi:hypothetical protein
VLPEYGAAHWIFFGRQIHDLPFNGIGDGVLSSRGVVGDIVSLRVVRRISSVDYIGVGRKYNIRDVESRKACKWSI